MKGLLLAMILLSNIISSNSFVHLSPIKYKLLQSIPSHNIKPISNIKDNSNYQTHYHIHYHSSNHSLNQKSNINIYLLLIIFMFSKDINFIILNIFFCIIQYNFLNFIIKNKNK
jgi:hypothetical protein